MDVTLLNGLADDISSGFFAIFNADERQAVTLDAKQIPLHRAELVGWAAEMSDRIQKLSSREIAALYDCLSNKIGAGDIAPVTIAFEHEGPREPKQDRHPLLRVVDLAAHKKRSVLAYSIKGTSSLSGRAKELGDEPYTCNPLIAPLFVDVENHQGYTSPSQELDFAKLLVLAAAFEDDVERLALPPEKLAENPGLLFTSFNDIVGEYKNGGMLGVRVDVPQLMKWEMIADKALKALSLEDLKAVYDFYDTQGGNRFEGGVARVIMKEIKSICMSHAALSPHLSFGYIRDETSCDVRVMHLVANRGRYPANLDEAFAAAFAQRRQGVAPAAKPPVPGNG